MTHTVPVGEEGSHFRNLAPVACQKFSSKKKHLQSLSSHLYSLTLLLLLDLISGGHVWHLQSRPPGIDDLRVHLRCAKASPYQEPYQQRSSKWGEVQRAPSSWANVCETLPSMSMVQNPKSLHPLLVKSGGKEAVQTGASNCNVYSRLKLQRLINYHCVIPSRCHGTNDCAWKAQCLASGST